MAAVTASASLPKPVSFVVTFRDITSTQTFGCMVLTAGVFLLCLVSYCNISLQIQAFTIEFAIVKT